MTPPDLVLYALTNDGVCFGVNISKYLKRMFKLNSLWQFAEPSKIDHRNIKEAREEKRKYKDSQRPLSTGVFENSEVRVDQGIGTMNIPNGMPVFIISPPYVSLENKVVDQTLTLLKGGVEKILYQAPDSPIFAVFPDFPYAMSHNQEKHLKNEGHHQAEFLRKMVIPELRLLGLEGMISLLTHAPEETLEACAASEVKYGKSSFHLPPFQWIDVNPYGGIMHNGTFIPSFDHMSERTRKKAFPLESYLQEMKNKNDHVIIITPDKGSRDKAVLVVENYSFPILGLEKVRYDEGKINFPDQSPSFDFLDYITQNNIKSGDKIKLVFLEDFVNSGGTGNKTSYMVKEWINDAVQKYYEQTGISLDIDVESILMVAHPKTVDPQELKLWNIHEVHYLTTHLINKLITPQMALTYIHVRSVEKNEIPLSFQPKRTIEVPYAAEPSLAAGIDYMLRIIR